MKSIAILGLFALIAMVSANQFYIQVILDDKYFEPVNGSLKVTIPTPPYQTGTYHLDETKLENGKIYASRYEIPLRIDEINEVTFYWALSLPIPPRYIFNKPSIYLKKVKVVPFYIQDPSFQASETRSFCPTTTPILAMHKQKVQLWRC